MLKIKIVATMMVSNHLIERFDFAKFTITMHCSINFFSSNQL
jgi:hypothetical protein